jgi:hypothetical protein
MSDTWIGAASSREADIGEALAKCAHAVDQRGLGRWRFVLSNGTELAVRARAADGWLALDAPLGGGPSPELDPWALLRRNARLAGGTRFALAGADRGLHLRADVPLDDEVDVRGRVLEACAGFKSAGAPQPDGIAGVAPGDPGLADLCRETAWEIVERESGRIAVSLDVPGTYQQAMVESRGGAGVAVTAPVADEGTARPTSICAQAVGVLLLRLCGAVRMVRAAGSIEDTEVEPRLEVVFPNRPEPRELGHAFGALSLAWRHAARQAAPLRGDESVAPA